MADLAETVNYSTSTRLSVGIATIFMRVFKRDMKLAFRATGQWLNPLLFFVIVVTLFPLGIGPGPNMLATIAPGVLWVSALLAMMLSLDALFANDFRDGTLEQMVLSGHPLTVVVIGKVMAHWVTSGLPLVILSPLLGLMMQLPEGAYLVLVGSLFLGTLSLSFIGAIGAALIVSVNQGGVLLSLLVLPLTVPVLIFGSGAVSAAGMGLEISAQLSVLFAIVFLAVSLAPLAIAGALRVGVAAGR
ncbi:Heme exporter protein B [Granulosicoccus antarcticus IMCC3135]|uniref:Heme exporter protein B n=2 Tax=Granulosicoccus TaxID=437504 RepID=A0A2Z2P176_9GAMM|nr:Heme exporter protein B [Granulosicoccus antarcticus IMCC3135]